MRDERRDALETWSVRIILGGRVAEYSVGRPTWLVSIFAVMLWRSADPCGYVAGKAVCQYAHLLVGLPLFSLIWRYSKPATCSQIKKENNATEGKEANHNLLLLLEPVV